MFFFIYLTVGKTFQPTFIDDGVSCPPVLYFSPAVHKSWTPGRCGDVTFVRRSLTFVGPKY